MHATSTADDPREAPIYTVAEVARYLHIPPDTVRSWIYGRRYPTQGGERYFDPLIKLPDPEGHRLSFTNLVEIHVLRALRTKHRVRVRYVRTALEYSERQLGIERLLLRQDLATSAGDVFLDHYGRLLDLSASGQIAIKQMLLAHLGRVEWDADELPSRLFPSLPGRNGANSVVIDPRIGFGRPTIAGKGVSTATIVERIDAGEPVDELAWDYDVDLPQIVDAILYERAA